MKKTNILKITLTLLLAFALNGAFAQFVASTSTASEAIDTVTVGATIPYYVQPDAYFNPSFSTIADTASVESTFAWDVTGVTGASLIWQSVNATAGNGNYVEVNFGNTNGAGQTISVLETAPAGCNAGSAITMEVRVIGTPAVSFSPDNAGTVLGGSGATLSFCEGDARLSDVVQLAFTQADLPNNPSYLASYEITVDTIQADATVSNIGARTETFSGASAVASNANTLDLAQPTGGFVCITNGSGVKRSTVYKYTILGVNDRISRKSDYLTNSAGAATGWTLYDTNAETVQITVNPVSVTGPIYHISNMWAN